MNNKPQPLKVHKQQTQHNLNINSIDIDYYEAYLAPETTFQFICIFHSFNNQKIMKEHELKAIGIWCIENNKEQNRTSYIHFKLLTTAY